jgi:acetolactate synthase-1/2/3 large subunit
MQGVNRVFCVAGESYLPVLDALLDAPEIAVTTCRQESGVTFMAESYAALENKPGVAFVTRGPGACNAAIGVHTAMQSSTPLVLFVGLVATADRDKEAFQEFDLPQMFGSLSKWAAVIDRADRIGDYTARAFHVASSGRPGPVVLGLPEDILSDEVHESAIAGKIEYHAAAPSAEALAQLRERLASADRPLIIAGGGGWRDEDCAELARFAGASHLPVAASFRRQDLFDHRSGNYVGELGTGPNPALTRHVKEADLILALGTRLSEITTQGYSLFTPEQALVHVYPDACEFGKSRRPALGIEARAADVCAALAGGTPLDGRRWAGWRDMLRQSPAGSPRWSGADMTQIFSRLRSLLPDDAIVTTDAGNFSGWCQRYLYYGRPGRLLAPISGAMGYAVPAAVAASLARPSCTVVGICGDGGFMMTGQELATAVHHGAKPVIIVCNNGMYGTIRMHQERDFPGRQSATSLTNPDFVKLAESYGLFAARVEYEENFEGAFKTALVAPRGGLLEIVADPRQITTQARP